MSNKINKFINIETTFNPNYTDISSSYFNENQSRRKIKTIIQSISQLTIPENINTLVNEFENIRKKYPKILSNRKSFLWKWLVFNHKLVTMETVSIDKIELLIELKMRQMIYAVLLDDISDIISDTNFTYTVINAVINEDLRFIPKKYILYVEFMIKIKQSIDSIVSNQKPNKFLLRNFHHFTNLFYSSLTFSSSINENLPDIEYDMFQSYLGHNMNVLITGTFDLIFSDKITPEKYGDFYDIFSLAQSMARIGNWVSTWEREVNDKDFTSGIFALLYEKEGKDIYGYDSKTLSKKIKEYDLENNLFYKWQNYFEKMQGLSNELKGVNLKAYMKGFTLLICMHYGSKGLK